MTTIPFTDKCKYVRAYIGRCGNPSIGDYCEDHDAVRCSSCGQQASHECAYTGQFVCGAPLCDGCEGWEDRTKSSGSWGFMNHGHRSKTWKEDIPPPSPIEDEL